MITQLIDGNCCFDFVKHAERAGWVAEYEAEKHQIRYIEGNQTFFLRLPIHVSYPINQEEDQTKLLNYVMVLIESGLSAVGYFEGEDNIDHKTFSAYMVRKKQGKSQIKHLKTKGKSRAGSRVRLSETLEFFDNINQRLRDYFETYRVDLIVVSCSKTLIPYFYGAKNPPPFLKSDQRIYPLPKHIAQCTHEQLMAAQKFLYKGELKYEEASQHLISAAIKQPNASADLEDEGW